MIKVKQERTRTTQLILKNEKRDRERIKKVIDQNICNAKIYFGATSFSLVFLIYLIEDKDRVGENYSEFLSKNRSFDFKREIDCMEEKIAHHRLDVSHY